MLFPAGEHEVVAQSGLRFLVRPVRSEDEPALRAMFSRATPEDVRFRILGVAKHFPARMAERLARIDSDRETTLVAFMDGGDPAEIVGVVHIVVDAGAPGSAEFDVMVRPDLKGKGLGYRLMMEVLDHARQRGLTSVEGYISRANTTMLQMAEELGFETEAAEAGVARVRVDLSSGKVRAAVRDEARA